jgi:hypothetical protein
MSPIDFNSIVDDELQSPLLSSVFSVREADEDANNAAKECQRLSRPEEEAPRLEEVQPVQETNDSSPVQLLLPLQLLFGLNGLTLGLAILAFMYVINTRVEIPLTYLPTYGAIAFLPYSLKPFYAYLNSSLCRNKKMNGNDDNSCRISRHGLLVGLLLVHGLLCIGFCYIPRGGVMLCFALAFARGIADSWAQFCVQLSLVDQARQQSQRRQQQQESEQTLPQSWQEEDGSETVVPIASAMTTTTTATISEGETYESMAARFQSQAATAGNMGAVFGGMVTFLLLVHRRLASPDQRQLSGSVADTLLISTGLLLVLGSFVTWSYRATLPELSGSGFQFSATSRTMPVPPQRMADDTTVVDEKSPLNSHPFYLSRGQSSDNEISAEMDGLEYHQDVEESPVRSEATIPYRASLLLVILLQLFIVALSLKDVIASCSSQLVWKILMGVLLLAMIVLLLHLFQRRLLSWKKTYMHRLGLFLIIRHALPSASMIVYSFIFSTFSSTPLLLQFLSLIGMAVTTLSSWSYGKLLARYCRGWQLQAVMVGTTVAGSVMSLGNILLVHQAQHHQNEPSTTFLNASDQEQSQTKNSYLLIVIALLVECGTSFTEEWQFLPDVVVATTSIPVDSDRRPGPLANDQRLGQPQSEGTSRRPIEDDGLLQDGGVGPSNGSHAQEQSMDTTAMVFGSLM